MNYIALIVIIILIIIVGTLFRTTLEFYNQGTITQLTAKDVQDTYLTNDAWKYIYSPLYPYYMYHSWPFYISTRHRKSQQPVYIGKYPYYNYVFNY